jgi:hypothetical protein
MKIFQEKTKVDQGNKLPRRIFEIFRETPTLGLRYLGQLF